MTKEQIPAEVRRFVQAAIPSVPYLEAILLLRAEREQLWDASKLSQRLYIDEAAARHLLAELDAASVIAAAQTDPPTYRYHPRTAAFSDLIDQLDEAYSKNLVAITKLIHSKLDKQAQKFADAFKLNRDS